ncbi:hypothetical protein [Thioalkalivibrio sp. AKL7]|nr:hypothetical protein [Thioalkalivibrio sp. AKL7]
MNVSEMPPPPLDGYVPIEDHGLIGDGARTGTLPRSTLAGASGCA